MAKNHYLSSESQFAQTQAHNANRQADKTAERRAISRKEFAPGLAGLFGVEATKESLGQLLQEIEAGKKKVFVKNILEQSGKVYRVTGFNVLRGDVILEGFAAKNASFRALALDRVEIVGEETKS